MFLLPVILASLARVGMLDPPRDMCVAGFMFNNPLQKAPRFWGMLRLTPMQAKNVVDLLHREFVQAHDFGLGAERGR